MRKHQHAKSGRKLGPREVEEEEYEHLSVGNSGVREAKYFESIEKAMHIGEIDLLINALEAEITMSLIRCSIHDGGHIQKR